jgi:hypothetical protein
MFKKIRVAHRGVRAWAWTGAARQIALVRASARAMSRGGRNV